MKILFFLITEQETLYKEFCQRPLKHKNNESEQRFSLITLDFLYENIDFG